MTSSNSDRPRRLGEFEAIAKFFAPLSKGARGAFGLADDVATVRVRKGRELLAKVDAIVESVHFRREDPAGDIAKKALRVNLSDLAAKGAEPRYYLLSLSLAPWCGEAWLARFATGLAQDQKRYGARLIGGDTTSTPGPLTISVTAFGTVAAGKAIRRAGAKPGDLVFVSGTIGDAGAGLAVLKGEGKKLRSSDRVALIARYRVPEPRVKLGRRLVGLASASLDVSDGLIADLGHIAETSGVRIVVDAERVPLSSGCVALWGGSMSGIARAATSGDDYEIAFTAPARARLPLARAARAVGVAISEIGRVEKGLGVLLVDKNGTPVRIGRAGYTHF
jgi:thiamine-monophosphate kinase